MATTRAIEPATNKLIGFIGFIGFVEFVGSIESAGLVARTNLFPFGKKERIRRKVKTP